MPITISDIAKRVGVDKSTVSLVLNQKKSSVKISAGTRQKVLEAVEELNYRPSFSARALAKGKTSSIGLVCGNIQSAHYSEFAAIALREAESRGYHLLISVTEWKTAQNNMECLESLLCRGVDGVISFGSLQSETKLYENIIREKFPMVTITDEVEGLSSVFSDWVPGMNAAMELLTAKGHRRVGYVRSKSTEMTRDRKPLAFLEACQRYGIQVINCDQPCSLPNEARQAGREFAHEPHRPSALVITSDQTASGFIRGLFDEGLNVPRDVAVIGIDGTDMGQYLHPALTSIAQDRENIMAKAMGLLMEKIKDRNIPSRRVLVPTRLIVRESV